MSAGQIEILAQEFREEFAPFSRGALEIDEIMEFDLEMTIVPRKNLIVETGKKAYLSLDGRQVWVDESLMLVALDEYRFLMTHELAHARLHKYLLPPEPVLARDEFRAWHGAMNDEMEWWLEWQAREWAGRVLVPRAELAEVFSFSVSEAGRLFRGSKVTEAAELFVEQSVASYFGVSLPCVNVRISKDNLWETVTGPSRRVSGMNGTSGLHLVR